MRDMEPASDESEMVAWSDNGRLLLAGEPETVDRYLREIEPTAVLDVRNLSTVADGLAALVAATGMSRTDGQRYVQLTKSGWEKVKAHGLMEDSPGVFHMFVKQGGKFAGNLTFEFAPLTGVQLLPIQVAAASAALRLAIQEMQSQVEEVARDVDDLKRMAEAADVGNLAGLYRILANARDEVDTHGRISQATWDAIAPHEVTAQQSADRVRSLLRGTLGDLPLTADAGDRTDAAQRLVDQGTVRRCLRLLLLAEQCRLLWRSLKLDQVRKTEEVALPGEIAAAEWLLEENAAADRSLIELLDTTIAQLGNLHPLDGLRLMSRRKLPALTSELRAELDMFAQLRKAQLESWAGGPAPTVGDAVRDVRARAARAAIGARNVTGRTFERFGKRLQGEPIQREIDHRTDEEKP